MPAPLVPQGNLNKVRASIVVSGNNALSINSSFLGKDMIDVQLGDSSELIGTATGAVVSPNPYAMATISVHLLKTNGAANRWLTQAKSDCNIGQVSVHSDTSAFDSIEVEQCILKNINPGKLNGTEPTLVLMLEGVVPLNSTLWDGD